MPTGDKQEAAINTATACGMLPALPAHPPPLGVRCQFLRIAFFMPPLQLPNSAPNPNPNPNTSASLPVGGGGAFFSPVT